VRNQDLAKTISFHADDEPEAAFAVGFDRPMEPPSSRNSDSYLVAIIGSENALFAARAVSEDFHFRFPTSFTL
jgi:hypothetical protein